MRIFCHLKYVAFISVISLFSLPAFADCYTDPVGTVGTTSPCLNMLIVDRTMLLAAVADRSYDFKPSDAYTTHNDGITYTFADGPNRIFTGQVTSLEDLFRLKTFNQDIGYWDTSRVTSMFRTFAQSPFNQDISGWDTSNVATMSQTFASNSAFNQNIGGWDTSSVTNMVSMFVDATSFNQNIGGWNVGSVTNMMNMFQGAGAFNGNITTWDVRSVTEMSNMFRNAVSFDQDIRVWVLKSQTVLPYQTNMFLGATLMLQNYGFTATPTKAQFSAPDTTAPSFDVAPSVGSVTSTGFTPSASIDEAGKIYYVVVADGATAPSAAQVKAGIDYSGVTIEASANVTVSSSPFTSSFAAITSLSASTAYDVYFVAEDDEGTPNLQSSVTKVDATTSAPPDTSAPTFTFNPANAATGVAVNSNVTITASEAIRLVAGNATLDDTNVDALITLKDTNASGTDIAFDATIVGNVITINPTSDFSSLQQVYVAIDGTAVEDTSDNAGALANATFITADTSAPTLASSNPADNATGVAVGSNIVLTFSENIQAGTGNIVISDGAGDTRTIPVGDAQITIAGTTLTINPTADLNSSTSYYVQVAATAVDDLVGNSYAGIADTTTLNFTTSGLVQTPATEFAENASIIRQILVDEADRSLRSAISTNRSMVQDARQRFIDSGRNGVIATRNNIPFDIDGVISMSGATLSTSGTFFGQQGSADGAMRRLFFGDFDIQRDANTGSNTATLSARVAWEQMVSETTMLGYFIGAELAESDLKGSFTGDQNRVALTLGGYAVHQLAEQVYFDGFLTLGAGRNDLNMANAVLSLDSDYTTRTATLGAAVSGIYEYEAYEFHPELSFSYGHTWIGNVGFTGRAYGLVDNTLSLNAGNVSMGNLIFRPEIIWGLDAASVADSHSQLSFAPRMICEQTRSTRKTEACGGGAELGLGTQSDDGLTNAEFRVLMDRVGSSERTSYAIKLEHRF